MSDTTRAPQAVTLAIEDGTHDHVVEGLSLGDGGVRVFIRDDAGKTQGLLHVWLVGSSLVGSVGGWDRDGEWQGTPVPLADEYSDGPDEPDLGEVVQEAYDALMAAGNRTLAHRLTEAYEAETATCGEDFMAGTLCDKRPGHSGSHGNRYFE